jgi:hypothetical protein
MPHKSFKLRNLHRRVTRLKNKEKQDKETEKKLQQSIKNTQECLVYLDGILSTHRAIDIPAHTSNKSFFYFKNRRNESCLIKELNPSQQFMPEMRRISITQAKIRKMRCGHKGFVVQRVLFSYPDSKHEQVLFCPDCCIVEKF